MIFACTDTSSAEVAPPPTRGFGGGGRRAGKAPPRALAAAHLVRVAIGIGGGKPHLGKEFADALRCRTRIGSAETADRFADHCADTAARIERTHCVLKDHLHTGVKRTPLLSSGAGDVPAVEEDAAARCRMQPRE